MTFTPRRCEVEEEVNVRALFDAIVERLENIMKMPILPVHEEEEEE